jgi:CRP-like cAMP-binding protein
MPATAQAPSYRNQILSALPKIEIAGLAPHLSLEDLPVSKKLLGAGEECVHVYFPETGMASGVVSMADGTTVETGITGKEGVVGLPALLGTKSMPANFFMQIGGSGYKIRAEHLSEAYERPGTLRKQINRFIQSYIVQTAQTAACNRVHEVPQRLARWLLMCHDRMESDTFPITQEFLGQMLGTPRTAVTVAAGALRKAGLIDYFRGEVRIRSRKRLEGMACECYRTIRNELDRLDFPPSSR